MKKKFPGDQERLRNLSIIEENNPKMVRMANLVILLEDYFYKYILVYYWFSYCQWSCRNPFQFAQNKPVQRLL